MSHLYNERYVAQGVIPYAKRLLGPRHPNEELLNWSIKLNLEPKVFLDAGCGDGYHAMQIASSSLNCDVVGIDKSEEAIRRAKLVHPHPRVTYIQGEVQNFSGSEVKFDALYDVGCAHLLPSRKLRKKRMSSYRNLLRPGGEMFLQVGVKVKHRAKEFYERQDVDSRQVYETRADEWVQLLKESGWHIKECTYSRSPQLFPDEAIIYAVKLGSDE